eukprot:CAMPEP_0119045494 /NCGR_PEP_ID=MMETSP1177-20130426/40407_1 /TAXON_ID=2985 /ORGANISM="Ochromonas sp, Strain CCMP1899" /LENGTH=393 /DNA_ID=CAMNT_0007017405 /DNA_START=295 /DNA_END=1476 /DNA_ORIENTATION=-
MKHGDLVIVYERHDSLNHVYLSRGTILNNKFGAFYHDDLIGKAFGSKVVSRSTSGWFYALEPSPELWSLAVHTRTQIVNELDASIITFNLDVFPGCVVVESGTGSGCMTMALARAIAPTGHVHTFEYNPARSLEAKEEFDKLGIGHLVTVTCKDVCGRIAGDEGGFPGVADQLADAVFLDLPEPWLAIDHVSRVLKPGRNLCCYSPCIEQVMKTCDRLRECGYHSIRMLEVRQRPFDGRKHTYETVDLGLEDHGMEPSSNGEEHSSSNGMEPSPNDNTEINNRIKMKNDNNSKNLDEKTAKKQKIDTADFGSSSSREGDIDENLEEETDIEKEARDLREAIYLKRMANKYVTPVLPTKEVMIARPVSSMKGHTAFLTFAVRPSIQIISPAIVK